MKQNNGPKKPEPTRLEGRKTRWFTPDPGHSSGRQKARRTRWQELGDFIVSFGYVLEESGQRRLETRVHYSQGDQSMSWSGVAWQALLSWIDSHARTFLPTDGETTAQPSSSSGASAAPRFDLVDCALKDVRSAVPNSLRASAHLQISSADVPSSTRQLAVEFVLTNLETMQPQRAGATTTEIMPDASDWAREVTCDFPVPEPGRYEVRTVVRASEDASVVAESRAVRLNVEP